MAKTTKTSLASLLARRKESTTYQELDPEDWLEPITSERGFLDPIPSLVRLGPRIVGYRLAWEHLQDQSQEPSEWELLWNLLRDCYDLFPRVYGSASIRVYPTCYCVSCNSLVIQVSTNQLTGSCDRCRTTNFSILALAKIHVLSRDITSTNQEELDLWQTILQERWKKNSQE